VSSTQNEGGEALSYYSNAETLAKSSYGENHPITANAYNRMGRYYLQTGEYDLAKRYFENAIEIRKNILGYNHVSTIEYLDNLAEASGALTDEIGKVETKKEANSLRDELGIKNKK